MYFLIAFGSDNQLVTAFYNVGRPRSCSIFCPFSPRSP